MNKKFTEKQILKGCIAGKAKYQKLFYEQFYGKMMSVCQRYTKSKEEAKDILHEGYIKAFKSLTKYKNAGSLEGWLRRIMVNTAINHYHKNRKYADNHSIEEDYQDLIEIEWSAENILQNLAYEDLLKLVRNLSPAYQAVFNLYVIEGYKHPEIAQMLSISVGTSKSNLAKARAKLQEELKEVLGIKSYSDYV